MTQKTVLILGANGRFGLATAQAFVAAGWRVLAQVRRHVDPAMPKTVIPLLQDYADTAALMAAALRHTDAVTAVVHGLNPEYTNAAWQREALPMAHAGMALAQALGALFMLPGNVYNFGDTMPAQLREDTACDPSTVKGRIRCDIEAEMKRRTAVGMRSVIIRAGDFYGGGTGGWIDQIIVKSLAKGTLVYPGPTEVAHAWAYLPDVGNTFVAVAEKSATLPAFSNLHFPGQTLTGTQLLDAIDQASRALGITDQPARRKGFSWWLIRIAGLFVPMFRSLREMSYLWRTPHGLRGEQLAALIGDIPATPLHESLRTSLQSLGLHHKAAA